MGTPGALGIYLPLEDWEKGSSSPSIPTKDRVLAHRLGWHGYPQCREMEYSDCSQLCYIFTQGWGMAGQKVSQPQGLKCRGVEFLAVNSTTQRKGNRC